MQWLSVFLSVPDPGNAASVSHRALDRNPEQTQSPRENVVFRRGVHALRSLQSSGFDLIVDSEKSKRRYYLPTYDADPVHLGEVLNNQYQVLAKLGYSVTSTVWLCRDLRGTLERSLLLKVAKENKETDP